MNIFIKEFRSWLDRHPKTKQWGWFVLLWGGGLATVTVLTYPIKLLMKTM